ncbi:MAG: hypothetical protein A2X49_05720 [Lentisphaerae bacterium GWF2_52_8]|nr:MAG: hypothetical protein A2X49_05720 [Lentisphaerae bacterium GWF2_52_8]
MPTLFASIPFFYGQLFRLEGFLGIWTEDTFGIAATHPAGIILFFNKINFRWLSAERAKLKQRVAPWFYRLAFHGNNTITKKAGCQGFYCIRVLFSNDYTLI